MPTNLALDDDLLAQALRLGDQRTKRATVNQALREYVARRRRRLALDTFGTFELEPYRATKRRRKR